MALDIKTKNKLHKPPTVGSFTGDKPAAIAARRAHHLESEQKQIVQSEAGCEEHTLPWASSCCSSGTVCWTETPSQESGSPGLASSIAETQSIP